MELISGSYRQALLTPLPRFVRHHCLGNTAKVRECLDMRAYPIFDLLACCSFGVGEVAGTYNGDKYLSSGDFSAVPIYDINRLSGVINKKLFTCPVFIAHDHIQPGKSILDSSGEPAVLIAGRVLFFVFLPQESQGDVLAGVQFFKNFLKIGMKQELVDAWGE